jgi:hypothetical protein
MSIALPTGNECIAKAASIRLNKSYTRVGIGESYQLQVKGTKSKVTWSSTDESIAIVNQKGVVTGIKRGKVKVIAKVDGKKYNCSINVYLSEKNLEDILYNQKIDYVEIKNQVFCVIENNSECNLNFRYDFVFYDASDNVVSLTNIKSDGFFKGDSTVLSFEKTDKEFSYYKIRFKDVSIYYDYVNQKNNVDVTVSEPYDYTYNYTDYISGKIIHNTEILKLMDLKVNNRSENRVMLEAYIIYYKDNKIVNIENMTQFNISDIDVGSTIIKNPITNDFRTVKVTIPEYDNYKLIYTAKTNR